MGIFSIVAIAVCGASFAVLIRTYRPEFSVAVGVTTGVIVLLMTVGELTGILDTVSELSTRYGVDAGYFGVLLKIIGISYVAQFGSEICKDAGESAVASRVELCGRILILTAALPAAIAVLTIAAQLLEGAVAG